MRRLATLILFLALAATAQAKVPAGWVGMQIDGPLIDGTVDPGPQMAKMRKTGVRSVRFAIYWDTAQPYETMSDVPAAKRDKFVDVGGVPTNFDDIDRLVSAAAQARLKILPDVLRAPDWAKSDPSKQFGPPSPAGDKAYAAFLKALIARYGPDGSYFKANDYLPQDPIRNWQIWNEPNGPFFWETDHHVADYVALLKAAYPAVKQADPKARVVLGGLFGKSWIFLRKLYAAGAKGSFDVVAIHPFTHKPAFVVRVAQYVRRVMKAHGNAKMPLAITEMSWPTSQGQSTKIKLDFDTTEAGQAVRVRKAYKKLAKRRKELHLVGVVWSTWLTRDQSPTYPFDYAGLLHLGDNGKITPKPGFTAFKKIIRKIEH